MDKIYIKDNKMVIEIPLEQERSSPYSDDTWLGDNIIGLIEPQRISSWPKCGFAYRIDMDYKGKADQWTDFFYIYQGDTRYFKKLCHKLKIEFYEYPKCSVCGEAIHGCSTWSDKGQICSKCYYKINN